MRGRMSKPIDPHCRAYQNAVELLARPWTGLILSLLQNGPLRFSELEESTRGVGAKTLSARLKELEARRIVARHVHSDLRRDHGHRYSRRADSFSNGKFRIG
jgi:DNA-binding HxlR family transcriptional regulator